MVHRRSKSTVKKKYNKTLLIIPEGMQTFTKEKVRYNEHRRSPIGDIKTKRLIQDAVPRRVIYSGRHTVPVFNLKVDENPHPLEMAFQIYRVGKKIYISAILDIGTTASTFLVNPNSNLMITLSEKLASKYLMSCENNFPKLIEDKIIVANSQLKIERMIEYTVGEVLGDGHFMFVDS
jgi:hypothetical protein